VHGNRLRYAAATGTVLIRWEGARQPTVWIGPAPDMDARVARLELARRYLHAYGPATSEAFGEWAGIGGRPAVVAFQALGESLAPVRTPVGAAWILSQDEAVFRARPGLTAPVRLLPSGDSFFLLQGADRELLVPDAARRRELWTSRVWPGALLVDGEVEAASGPLLAVIRRNRALAKRSWKVCVRIERFSSVRKKPSQIIAPRGPRLAVISRRPTIGRPADRD
jgi:Winged helix DNA-binding domain